MTRTTKHGLPIRFDDRGAGEPALLFLPGWCTDRTVFRSLPHRCSARRRTIVLDWRGHGESERAPTDFGSTELLADALAVLESSGVGAFVPVALAHAGWTAIALRERLGERVRALVFVDWFVAEPPRAFLSALARMRSAGTWRGAVDELCAAWLNGADEPELEEFVHERTGSYDFLMWSRAAREIESAYRASRCPLDRLQALNPPLPCLHLWSETADRAQIGAQEAFARAHPWFRAQRLEAARTHFPMFEVPGTMALAIESFLGHALPAARKHADARAPGALA